MTDPIEIDDAHLATLARTKVTCPFLGPAVRRGELAVLGSAERPMARVEDVVRLGDLGGGDLGQRVLRIFAIGNHRRVPGPDGRFVEPAPEGMMSLDLAGSQGAHAGHSGIMLGDPGRLGAGRFSAANFARLAAHADAQGRLDREAVGRFIARNVDRDPAARVLPVGRMARSLFGLADEVGDSLIARLRGRRTARDEAELLEKLTRLSGEDNLIGSAGEFGLLFAFFADRGDGRDGGMLYLDEIEAMMRDLRLPAGWENWPKRASNWVHATARIAAAATGVRIRDALSG